MDRNTLSGGPESIRIGVLFVRACYYRACEKFRDRPEETWQAVKEEELMATTRTVLELIEGALRVAGVYEAGETLEADASSTALDLLQDILAEMTGNGLVVPFVQLESFTLTAGQISYTVGENGSPDKNMVRPEDVIGAYVRSGGYDYNVRIIKERGYRKLTDKDAEGRPDRLWYNPTVPNGTIYLYPAPDDTDDLHIYCQRPLQEPSALTDNLLNDTGLPRHYHNSLKWLLGIELCQEYGRVITPFIAARARSAESTIISLNAARRVQPSGFEIHIPGGHRADSSILND